jgi:hypothetical protein
VKGEVFFMDVIKIEDVVLNPYSTVEIPDDDLSISLNAEISHSDYERLNRIRLKNIIDKVYFDVEYENNHKKMRFGQVLYSEHDDKIKARITLVDKKYDDENDTSGFPVDPSLDNLKKEVASLNLYIHSLESLLKDKGIISPEEINQLRDYNKIDLLEEQFKLYKVKDIDDM